jgi:hypothetical protein
MLGYLGQRAIEEGEEVPLIEGWIESVKETPRTRDLLVVVEVPAKRGWRNYLLVDGQYDPPIRGVIDDMVQVTL